MSGSIGFNFDEMQVICSNSNGNFKIYEDITDDEIEPSCSCVFNDLNMECANLDCIICEKDTK